MRDAGPPAGAVRAGESRTVVVRGDPGVGKSALLEYVVESSSGCRVVRAPPGHRWASCSRSPRWSRPLMRRIERRRHAAASSRDGGDGLVLSIAERSLDQALGGAVGSFRATEPAFLRVMLPLLARPTDRLALPVILLSGNSTVR
jgi:hypothetical protein